MCCEMVNLENMLSEISQSLRDKYQSFHLYEIPLVVSVYAILLYTSIIYMDKINSVSYKSIKEEKIKLYDVIVIGGREYYIIIMVMEVTF